MDSLLPVRFSKLKLIALSPAHYLAAIRRVTQVLERGLSVHSILLGGQRIVAYPGPVRRGKVYDAFCAENPDALVVNRNDYDKAMGMVESVRRNRQAMELLEGQRELEVDWTYLGRKCQSHVDVVGPGARWVTELKTAVSSEPGRFAWQAHKLAYFGQVAFYLEAIREAGLGEPTDAYFVAVENKEPYVVSVMRAADDALEMGRRTVRLWMEQLLACEAADQWPGYVQGIVDLHAPSNDIEFTFGDEADSDAAAGDEDAA